jgi:hypothetical protein
MSQYMRGQTKRRAQFRHTRLIFDKVIKIHRVPNILALHDESIGNALNLAHLHTKSPFLFFFFWLVNSSSIPTVSILAKHCPRNKPVNMCTCMHLIKCFGGLNYHPISGCARMPETMLQLEKIFCLLICSMGN